MRALHQRITDTLADATEPMSTSSIAAALGASRHAEVGRHLRAMRELGLVERVEAKPGGGTTWTLTVDDDPVDDEGDG
jgi:DNA-binding transcriptional ArsR family regulator